MSEIKRYDTTDIDQMANFLIDLRTYFQENEDLLRHVLRDVLHWDKEKVDCTLTDSILIPLGQITTVFDTAVKGVSNLLQGTKAEEFKQGLIDGSFMGRFNKSFADNDSTIKLLLDSLQKLEYELSQSMPNEAEADIGKEAAKAAHKVHPAKGEHVLEQGYAALDRLQDAFNVIENVRLSLDQHSNGLDINYDDNAADTLFELLEEASADVKKARDTLSP